MDLSEKKARIALACDYNVSPQKLLILLERYGSAQNIISHKERDLLIRKTLKDKIGNISSKVDLNETVVFGEDLYPKLLAQIPDPPLVLFFKGDFNNIDFDKCIGIVGTRKITNYGISVTKGLVRFLVERGYIIVSGLAYGIDALAHQETLAYGGRTIAILGTSINDPYPQAHIWLYNKIIKNNGLVFSESLQRGLYGKWIFPKRNRIIAGLCKKLIVIEAPQKSGALITANYSSDFNREVFGIPGEMFCKNSVGIHNLIKDNKAKILSKFEDIFDDDQLVLSALSNNRIICTKDESEVVKSILMGNKTIESLVENLRYDINMLLCILGRLELNNVIEKFEDGSYMVK